MLRLDNGSTLGSIKRSLRPHDELPASSEPIIQFKCRRDLGEAPCAFAARNDEHFTAPAAHSPAALCCANIHSQAKSAAMGTCQSCSAQSSDGAIISDFTAAEEPTINPSEEFIGFTCKPDSSSVCLDGQCYDQVPVYRAARSKHPRFSTRSSPVAGGGDAFDVYTRVAFGARATYDLVDEYEQVAIIDSGANKHWFRDQSGIQNRRPADFRTTTADGSQVRVTEQGDYLLECVGDDGNVLEPLVLRDVSVIKGSPINLVSVGVMCNEGSIFHFEHGNSYLEHDGRRIPLIERNGLYLLRLDAVLPSHDVQWLRDCESKVGNQRTTEFRSKLGNSYACAASYELWHSRFGGASKKRLKFIFDNGSAEGMEIDGQRFKHNARCTCPTCSSMHNAKLHIGDTRKFADSVTQKGQLVYTDVCGPFPASVEGFKYVISFTDVYSRFSACYMLKQKSDSEHALEAYISFCARNGILIREIRSDQGGEYGGHHNTYSDSGEAGSITEQEQRTFFKRLCDQHNIRHVLTPAYRPELHGLAERWNLSIMKMANSLLFSARLSHILWPSAVAHANMLRNRLPVTGLGTYTPYEIFYGKRPRIDQLRIFGSDCYKLLPVYPKIPGQIARKRLIYVGETADRIGFRCFDPITYKFTTEFELIFDEQSAKKRINSLYEHDIRRDLQKAGKLSSLPLQTDNFASYDAHQQAVRNVFSSASPQPNILPVREAKHDDTVLKDGGSSDDSTPKSFREAGSASLNSASVQLGSNAATEPSNNIRPLLSRTGPHSFADGKSAPAAPSDPIHRVARLMGREAALQEPHRELTRDMLPTSTTEEREDEDIPEEFKIYGRTIRSGPLPTLRPRKHSIDYDLRDIDAAPILSNDAEAQQRGPLTAKALADERRRSQQHPQLPRRPLRYLPIGQAENDTQDFKAFRKFAFENDIPIKLVDNPKRKQSQSFQRYARYQPATTLREIIELSATSAKPIERKYQIQTAHADIVNDCRHGYILFPQHEHNSSANFVDAVSLASIADTTNFHVLYSSTEISSACAHLSTTGLLHGDSIRTSAQHSAFHDQIKGLWEHDGLLQPSDSSLKHESALAASLIQGLVTGDIPEPANFRKVEKHPERAQWLESMARERATLEGRGTWELVPRSSIGSHRPVKCKYVFKKKLLKDFSLQFKSRLVACGYSQIAGLDYASDETYAGVCS